MLGLVASNQRQGGNDESRISAQKEKLRDGWSVGRVSVKTADSNTAFLISCTKVIRRD